jgi:NitT/TauT family transport system ATP-binding protein
VAVNGAPLLDVRSLSVSFSEEKTGKVIDVLDDVGVEVREGELVCIAGPSGCGKTTLLRTIAGLVQPREGEVLIDGKPVRSPGPDRGLVFQDYALFPWSTALKNVMFGLTMRGMGRKEAEEAARGYVSTVGLEGFENMYPRELSGGMKQRVAIARTLAVEPRILLMDEPFASLDAQTRLGMQEFLIDLWRETGKTILFVTHSVDEAVFLGERVIGLSRRPARVMERFDVPLEYPRDRGSREFTQLRGEILDYLRKESEEL